jgi:DNA-binding transcriptional LysR family regulator
MLAGLRAGQLQVALTVQPPRKMLRGLQFRELARYPLCAAFPPGHALAGAKTVSFDQLAGEPLIAYSRKEYPEYHEMLDDLFGARRKPSVAEEHDGISSIIAAVESGRGFALVPQCVECMAGPRVKLVPLDPAPEPFPVGAAWKEGAVNAEEFVAAAEEGMKK